MITFVKHNLGIFIVIFLSFWAIRPLFHSGFFPMHDDQQIARLYEFDLALKNGQIPPRWVQHLGFGYGFPLFNFYPPLVYYFGELFYTLGFSLIASTKIVMGLGFVLSAFFMYLWAKKHFGVLPGFVAAALYTYAPYHAVDLYVRGALAEFFSFVWIPAVFWSLDNLLEKKTLGWGLITGVFLSLVVLTHNLIALPFILFFALYSLFISYLARKEFVRISLLLILSGIVSLGLTAYFWLPSLLEKKFTLVDDILTRELANFNLHFVCLKQLWDFPWGYGGSVPYCSDGISFEIGKIHIVLFIATIFLFSFLLMRKRNIEHKKIILLSLSLFIISVFMTTSYSKIAWDTIQPLSYLQFPWRYLLFVSVFSSFIGGAFMYLVQRFFNKKVGLYIGIFIIIVTIISSIGIFRPERVLQVADRNYTTNQDIEWRISKTSFEYVPKGVATTISDVNTTQLDITRSEIPNQPFTVINGDIIVDVLQNIPHKKTFQVASLHGGTLQINTFSFPGWATYIDGSKVDYSDNNRLKLITLDIPSGNHTIQTVFENTQIRTIGNSITLITSLAVLFLGIISGRKAYLSRSHEKIKR